jgi:hypothetical protein
MRNYEFGAASHTGKAGRHGSLKIKQAGDQYQPPTTNTHED